MTPSSLYDAIREDFGTPSFAGEVLSSDTDSARSVSGAPSGAEMLPLVWSVADEVASLVKAQHVPKRIRPFSGPVPPSALRVLPTRVYGAAGRVDVGESGPVEVGDTTIVLESRGGALLRVDRAGLRRRRATSPATYSLDDGDLVGENINEFDAVAQAEARGASDDLGLPAMLEHAVVLGTCAALAASRQQGRWVVYRNAYTRALAPYLRDDVQGIEVAEGEGETAA